MLYQGNMRLMDEAQDVMPNLRMLLVYDHERLERLFEGILAACEADSVQEIAHEWRVFENGLQQHLALEEAHIFPEFIKVDAVETAILAREHAEIRQKLDEFGLAVDLHCARTEAVSSFIQALKAHAMREDALMYRWAQANLGRTKQARIRVRLRETIRRFLGRGGPQVRGNTSEQQHSV